MSADRHLGTEHFSRVLRETWLLFMNMKVRGLAEPVLCERINIQKVELSTMDYRIRRQKLLKRAKHVEEEASCVKNAQAQDVMQRSTGRWQKNSKIAGCSNAVSFPWTLPISPVAINQ
jgi:hypothetical protein